MLPFVKITSKDNSLIKLVTRLQNSGRSRREHGLFVIEGLRLCRDAAENGFSFHSLLISEDASERYADVIAQLAERSGKCYILSDSLFAKISDTATPQGIMCLCSLGGRTHNIKPDGRYIALENLSDPSNLGAVSRTAEALGLDGIILSSGGCDPFSPKSLRASMGALLRLPVIALNDFPTELKESGLALFACVVDKNAKSITDIRFRDGCAVLVGNEANGLTPEAVAVSAPITIEMSGRAESLNAAVAASIAMWEMMRQV